MTDPTEKQGHHPSTAPLSDTPQKGQREDQPLKELNDTPEGEKQPGDRAPEKRKEGR